MVGEVAPSCPLRRRDDRGECFMAVRSPAGDAVRLQTRVERNGTIRGLLRSVSRTWVQFNVLINSRRLQALIALPGYTSKSKACDKPMFLVC